jgi:zinc finger HIT domain-containing protein 1
MAKKKKLTEDELETEYEDPNLTSNISVGTTSRTLRSKGTGGTSIKKTKTRKDENYEIKKRFDQLEADNHKSESFIIENKKRKRKEEKFMVRRALDTVIMEDVREDEFQNNEDYLPLYYRCEAKPSNLPARKFCSVCGKTSKYKCPDCGMNFCCLKCNNDHKETRCLKFVQ